MKTTTKTLFAAIMLLAISCKKESNTIQSSSGAAESSAQAILTDVNDPATYVSVKLAGYVMMKKNLNVSRYRNGDKIPQVKDPAKWAALTTGAWCWYNNDSANGAVYGKLYNWYAVNDPRGLAPAGWHVPSDAEWTKLSTYLGGEAVAGGKMKSTGTIEDGTGLWHAPNYGATNSSGFTGLPGGYRSYDGTFYNLGFSGCWWSSTQTSPSKAWSRNLYYNYIYTGINEGDLQGSFSVRCLRD